MKIKFAGVFSCALAFALAPPLTFAADPPEKPNPAIAPIQELSLARPSADLFGDWKTPTVIRTAAESEKFFEGKALGAMKGEIDWENQTVLIFAWRGSGQDKLEFVVAESFPEQVRFTMKRGRTRDLRPHIHLFALRKNVKWSTGDR